MPRRNPIIMSFLVAWVAAWLGMTFFMMTTTGGMDAAWFLFISICTGVGTLVVVGATWLVVAVPYFFALMRRPIHPMVHHVAGAAFAIIISLIITGGDLDAMPFFCIPALLSSFSGIQTMLHCLKSEPNETNTPDRDPVAPMT